MIWDMYWAFIGESTVMTQISIMELEVTIWQQLVMDGLKLITCGNVGFVGEKFNYTRCRSL
jgi:hypothetical protein